MSDELPRPFARPATRFLKGFSVTLSIIQAPFRRIISAKIYHKSGTAKLPAVGLDIKIQNSFLSLRNMPGRIAPGERNCYDYYRTDKGIAAEGGDA